MPPQIAAAPAVGVRFFDPVDHYLQVTRAVKHAVLVILLTFAALFLLEVLARLRVHPVQYLLVGCALTVFYLLLLSLSEQVAFPIAYGAASGAVVLLVAGYTAAVLGRWQRGLAVSCGLALVYGILFVILRAEQLALLAGSITVFLALAALMLTTRRVDWYSLDRRPAPGSGPAQTPLTD
jgi:inner membrane protein